MFLLNLPLWAALLLLLVIAVLISHYGIKLVHKFYKYEHLKESHEISGFIFNAYGLLYAVVIAFVIYINWGEYNEAQRKVYVEINSASNLFHSAQGFNDSAKKIVMANLIAYTETVYFDDFGAMEKLNRSEKNRAAYDSLWDSFLRIDAQAAGNQILYDHCLSELRTLSEARRMRYHYMENTIPIVIWVVMIVGYFIALMFAYLFGMKYRNPYLILLIAFTYINILMLYLILVLDYPFTGYSAISKEPYAVILNHFKEVFSAIK